VQGVTGRLEDFERAQAGDPDRAQGLGIDHLYQKDDLLGLEPAPIPDRENLLPLS
jgi:hypothetical protein